MFMSSSWTWELSAEFWKAEVDPEKCSGNRQFAMHTLRDRPQNVNRDRRPENGAAVADRVDQLVKMLDLQAVVKGVPEAVGPKEQ